MPRLCVTGYPQPDWYGSRAVPTLHIRDSHMDEMIASIHNVLDECRAEPPVFYGDEVDIHLNPKIGADWQSCGQQKRVVTPGQNEKYYQARALHSGTGKVSYVCGCCKSSVLFISLLNTLKPRIAGQKPWITTSSIKAVKRYAG